MASSPETKWHQTVVDALKNNDVRLMCYVPDNVLRPLIELIESDSYFTVIPTTREEEAVGILAGAYMAGLRGIALMQTSGFATIPNVLASLAVAFQLPVVCMVSERGTLGEFNPGQALVCRTMRPVLDSLAMEHHGVTRLDESFEIIDRTLKQAFATRAPATLILSPLLTGGKSLEKSKA